MINLPAVIISECTGLSLMVLVAISHHRSAHYGLLDDKLYSLMVGLTMLLCSGELATFVLDGKAGAGFRILSLAVNSIVFMAVIIFAFTWALYADFKLFEDGKRLKKRYPIVAIPAILVLLGCLVNFFTPVFFAISSENVYSRRPLFFFPYAVTYFYLAYGVALIYRNRRKVRKYLFMPAVIFMIPILIGSLLQYFFYGYALIWLGVSVAMVSLYINVQNEASSIDSLSGLFGRQYLSNYLRGISQRKSASKPLAGFMLDIDQFKSINDRYGHLTGDDAVATVGQLLREAVGSHGFAARYAGDEFIILQPIDNEAEVQQTIDRLRTLTEHFNRTSGKPYKLQFSIGSTLYREREDVDAFLGRMDAAMYEEKKRKQRG